MKHSLVPLFLFLVLGVQAADLKLATGDMELTFTKVSTGYQTHLIYNGTDMPFIEAGKPAYLEVQGKPVSGSKAEFPLTGQYYITPRLLCL